MVRPPCCDKLSVKKGWAAKEDTKTHGNVSKHGTANWSSVSKKTGVRKCGKICKLKWSNCKRHEANQETFTPQEEDLIIRLHAAIGSRWPIIAQQLPGKTDNEVKNHWNTKLRKKLSEMGIDPVTHKPFSQILADYGNINQTLNPKPETQFRSLNVDMKNIFQSKPDISSSAAGPFSSINSETELETTTTTELQNPNLLSQLQSIKFVPHWAKNQTVSANFFHEKSSSSSSTTSSSTCSTAGQAFSWRDFLLDDDFLPENQKLPQEQEMKSGLKGVTSTTTIQTEGCPNGMLNNEAIDSTLPSSSSARGFVEAMMDRENDIFLGFPEIMEEPFYN